MYFSLPEKVNKIIKLLKDNGFEAYAVGGCVRDTVMGIPANDFDITTSALPEETKKVFSNYRIIENGIKHGTVTVIIDKEPFEITTYRIDGDYLDNRRPKTVSFSRNLKDDLARRDFTVNTLCYNEDDGLIDVFGGINDIENKVIRCVGDAKKRFREDALRIMRALRFSAVLGFEIEKETADAIKSEKDLLKNIATERIRDEFTKLVCGKNAPKIIAEYHEVIEIFIPEISALFGCKQNTPYHIYDVAEHTLCALGFIENSEKLKLAMFFHDIAKPICKKTDENSVDHFKGHALIGEKLTFDILKRMRYDNKTVNTVSRLVAIHSDRCPVTKQQAKLMLCEIGVENYSAFIKIRRADCLAKANPHSHDIKLENMQIFLEEILKNEECFSLKDLKINGNILKKLGVKEGKNIQEILQKLLYKVINEECENSQKSLVASAEEIIKGTENGEKNNI